MDIAHPEPALPAWRWHSLRFALAWTMPLALMAAAWRSPWAAWAVGALFPLLLALLEQWPRLAHSPPPVAANAWSAGVLRVHVLLQAALLAVGVYVAQRVGGGAWSLDAVAALLALGIGVGGVSGSQGITFAHELGHSRSRLDRALAWFLMASVNYGHFMVEHYRGHHVRAATWNDPATARRGESLWAFLPRTLVGSWRSAWALEEARLKRLGRGWWASPLLGVVAVQGLWLAALVSVWGGQALLFWLVQGAYAVFLLETINYIEHYGLQRGQVGGRHEAFGVQHAWNADHLLTNCFIANLQRHSDHHLHASKPYPSLEALPGPQLPTGYAGCLLLATVPRWWFGQMHPRLDALAWAADRTPSEGPPHDRAPHHLR